MFSFFYFIHSSRVSSRLSGNTLVEPFNSARHYSFFCYTLAHIYNLQLYFHGETVIKYSCFQNLGTAKVAWQSNLLSKKMQKIWPPTKHVNCQLSFYEEIVICGGILSFLFLGRKFCGDMGKSEMSWSTLIKNILNQFQFWQRYTNTVFYPRLCLTLKIDISRFHFIISPFVGEHLAILYQADTSTQLALLYFDNCTTDAIFTVTLYSHNQR